jgi:lipopolysaccharide transport system ATP-binding protein
LRGFAELVGGRMLDGSGAATARLPMHEPIRCTMRYRVLKDVPFKMIPNFHFYQQDGHRFFIAFPAEPAPSVAGEYEAVCHIPPFFINNGRYTVALILSSYELADPCHFVADRALRFEVYEAPDSDPRRHGWTGYLPGVSRPHLDWEVHRK